MADDDTVADAAVTADDRARADDRAMADDRSRPDHRVRMHPGILPPLPFGEQCTDLGVGKVGVGHQYAVAGEGGGMGSP